MSLSFIETGNKINDSRNLQYYVHYVQCNYISFVYFGFILQLVLL